MPTRKQRRRRDKTFRHEYETVLIDEAGTETPLADLRTHEEPKRSGNGAGRGGKGDGKSDGKKRSSRPVREVQPPSWQRALRRGGTWGAVMLFVSIFFLFRGAPIAERVLVGLLYGVMFVPLTYFVDRTAYNAYLRRTSGASKKNAKKE
jgi:hypothetical protein